MTYIDLDDGRLYLSGKAFPFEAIGKENNGQPIGKNYFTNLSRDGVIKEIPFRATGYYKNDDLSSIILTTDIEYLNKHYERPEEIDFRDYLEPYLHFCKTTIEAILSELLMSQRRKFKWGKIKVQVEPRVPNVYGEIKYF